MILTKKAILNAGAAFIDQAARILVGFFVTPILVMYLGQQVFGLWQVIHRVANQIAPVDGRAGECLKWTVANIQLLEDDEKRRRVVGAAFGVFAIYFPALIVFMGVWVWYSPYHLNVEESLYSTVRVGGVILGFNIILVAIFSIFEAVLRGVNKGYKRVGVLASILILGGLMSVMAVKLGHGIQGLAMTQLLTSLLILVTYYFVVRKHVAWFGVMLPSKEEFMLSLRRSRWFVMWAFVNIGIYAGDIIILSFYMDAENVSKYVLTFYAANMITVAILTAVSSALPGLGGLVGAGKLAKAAEIRKESLMICWVLSVSICSVLLMLNKSFVSLWVGEDVFAGDIVNLFIMISAIQLVFIRHDAFMLNMMLEIKDKVTYGFLSLMITLSLSAYLVPSYGVIGLSLSLIIGRLLLSYKYPALMHGFLKMSGNDNRMSVRTFVVALMGFGMSWFFSGSIYVESWVSLFGLATLFFALFIVLYTLLGLGSSELLLLKRRLSSMVSIK